MGELRLSYPDGKLLVEWPNHMIVIVRSDCSFELKGAVPAKVTFEGGKGRGTADFAIGTPNHPDEQCSAKGVQLEITKS
jgi:hypothetical protein